MTTYAELYDAMQHTTPGCAGDDRFITDLRELGNADKAELREICRACPLLDICEAYAVTEKPPAAWWPTNLKVRTK